MLALFIAAFAVLASAAGAVEVAAPRFMVRPTHLPSSSPPDIPVSLSNQPHECTVHTLIHILASDWIFVDSERSTSAPGDGV